ncbi:GLPGLI family protein [Flavobacterium sp. LC2016-12]|uniref:GLPGLI family protein n=1 Tax=Flavobacterium sp. LC2016-12 TaxID=2783794 RepID=UPI00188DBA30|nr:GLPGLI family protein [Flavobacterium sp. LC2016-12]MBF4464549.1 GLPGLI family protein [Flavobacterium sp. LC2016-12]
MKKIIILLAFLNFLISTAQNKGIVYYGYRTTAEGAPYSLDFNSYMIFSKDQSYYVTAKDSLEKAETKKEEKIIVNDDTKTMGINSGLPTSSSGSETVYNIPKKTMWSSYIDGKKVHVKEIVPKINWKLINETKKIGNFTCKKASTFFRGRNYTAWYNPEIAVPFGPWKFQGLPGLILEVSDDKKMYKWYFKSIEYPTNSKETVKYISLPKKMNFITFEEFQVFQKETRDKQDAKQKMAQKKFSGVYFNEPKISDLFIEF